MRLLLIALYKYPYLLTYLPSGGLCVRRQHTCCIR